MKTDKKFIIWFKDLGIKDVPRVGGKNAALGEMIRHLKKLEIAVPDGFAITSSAYYYFLEKAGLSKKIRKILRGLDTANLKDLQSRGRAVRQAILNSSFPDELAQAILPAYRKLGKIYGPNPDVAVRSSATAEDLPDASFAGQQETYLNVVGEKDLLVSVKKGFASLFTDRAISYRTDKGFPHLKVALSVGVQKMVRSDLGSSGVMFTIDTETGFDKIVLISASYGLGETIVQGQVIPDEFIVFKPALLAGQSAIIGKKLGRKLVKLVYDQKGTVRKRVEAGFQKKFCLSDKEVLKLAVWGVNIEKYFSRQKGHYQPMDIEWAKDGRTHKLFIVQARPETVHSVADKRILRTYELKSRGRLILTGIAVGSKIGAGQAKVIKNPKEISRFHAGEILVTELTDPDWEPIMKMAAAIITDKGGRTSHAAIVSRELGIPCIVGTKTATKILKDKMPITVDCSSGTEGRIFSGIQKFKINTHHLDRIPKTRTHIMVNIGSPEDAFAQHHLPVFGVGLGRLEFIIASAIRIHPNALLNYPKGLSRKLKKQIDELTQGYADKKKYYIQELAFGIAKIAAAFWPHEAIIRFSDFKTNEYRKLLGGERYEPLEENPMLGWRGASRYYDPKFAPAFGLECLAIKLVRETMGFSNVTPMVPFCRTPEEGKRVLALMAKNGLVRGKKNLKVYVMCEIPSNVLLASEFLKIFDGMSIGSNDLTQLTLGLDRDSGIVSGIANENNPSVKILIKEIIEHCRAQNKYIGICGQAPSDYPEFVKFLLKNKIKSISLNPDSVISTILNIAKYEKIL
jgi:pyruvate,water dikinase